MGIVNNYQQKKHNKQMSSKVTAWSKCRKPDPKKEYYIMFLYNTRFITGGNGTTVLWVTTDQSDCFCN